MISVLLPFPHISGFDGSLRRTPVQYYGTHPQIILRGMVYEDHESHYFKNLVDQLPLHGEITTGVIPTI